MLFLILAAVAVIGLTAVFFAYLLPAVLAVVLAVVLTILLDPVAAMIIVFVLWLVCA